MDSPRRGIAKDFNQDTTCPTSDVDMNDKYRWSRATAVLVVVWLGCLAMTHAIAVMASEGGKVPVASQQGTLGATAVFPANNAKNVCPDMPLRITFASAPIVGDGEIQILDASNDVLVETINVSVSIRSKSIGGLPNFNYYSIIINDHVASIYLSNALAYDKTYYVKIDPRAFKSAVGEAFAGFTDSKAWRFSTRAKPRLAGGNRITVAADGRGDFATVQGALDFVPEGNTTPITIFIRNGIYNEIIFFTGKNNLTILGEDRKKTIIAYANNDRFNNKAGGNPFAAGAPLPGTIPARSGAVYRRGLFLAHRVTNLTIANLTLHNTTPQGGSQAEALILNGTPRARAIITDVDLYSFQDTLQINGQAYVNNCYIEGDVDFMWGTGPTLFENCELKSLRSNGYFTQVRNPISNHGFVFKSCMFEGAPGITGNFLSRVAPARFPASEVVLIDCTLTDAVGAVGWRLDQVTQPAVEAPNVHYWEYISHDSVGRPVDISQRLAIARQLKLPDDGKTIANYGDPKFVLGDEWTPLLAPIITTPPASVSASIGGKATLSVSVAAVPAPKYQWQKNGRNIVGAAQSVYAIERVDSRDAGRYRVVIFNTAGKVTSRDAKLTVISIRRRSHLALRLP
jgi:pectin methylesterase-like acyl-CoA thioesterase